MILLLMAEKTCGKLFEVGLRLDDSIYGGQIYRLWGSTNQFSKSGSSRSASRIFEETTFVPMSIP